MREKIQKQTQKVSSLVKYMKLNTILPFTEKPSQEEPSTADPEKRNKLGASDLFSQFTANIIKEEVVFTR